MNGDEAHLDGIKPVTCSATKALPEQQRLEVMAICFTKSPSNISNTDAHCRCGSGKSYTE